LAELPPKSHYPAEHANHLCFMVARQGLLTKIDINRVKKLVAPAKFVCADCGRVAAKSENLCNPVEL
jgi:hydrogenase/urease accessory protein HupE